MVDPAKTGQQQPQQTNQPPTQSTNPIQAQPPTAENSVYQFSHHSTSPQPPQPSPTAQLQQHYHPPRVLTSSNSFDSKSNLPSFAGYHMSAEAARLFQTLQQSPLPVANDVINYC